MSIWPMLHHYLRAPVGDEHQSYLHQQEHERGRPHWSSITIDGIRRALFTVTAVPPPVSGPFGSTTFTVSLRPEHYRVQNRRAAYRQQ